MPTKTFLNLPNDKKMHFLKCARDEFTRNTLMDASINKIIQEANIPRGSFYQYFEDKEDLYFYIFDLEKENIMIEIQQLVNESDNISEIFLHMYDFLYSYIVESNHEDYYKNAMITFHKLEVKPGEKNFFFDGALRQLLKEKIKLDSVIALELLEIMSFTLSKAVIDSLKEKENQKDIRKKFYQLLEIFENGYRGKENEA